MEIRLDKEAIKFWCNKTIFNPDFQSVKDLWEDIENDVLLDYARYYTGDFYTDKIKYYPGLLATTFYRISRSLFLKGDEKNASEFASVGTALTGCEIYYSASI